MTETDLSTQTTLSRGHEEVNIQPQRRASASHPVRCWAHTRDSQRCQALVSSREGGSREGEPIPIPYCERHLQAGDGALKVVKHPFAGFCLVARFDLPPRYRLVFHGNRGPCDASDREDRSLSFYPPNPTTGSNFYTDQQSVKVRKTNNYNGILNPKGTGDIMQYAACPGPSERQNLRSTFQYFGVRNGQVGGLEFVTTDPVPKHTQLCFWYGAGWWTARGVKRRDVGTPKYPVPKRRKRAVSIKTAVADS
jgi:hypothetical protein